MLSNSSTNSPTTLKPNYITAYTDGWVHSPSNTSTCAVFIPKRNIKQAWILTKHTSIYSAELFAIEQALQILYPMDWAEGSIFTDYKAAVLAIKGQLWNSNHTITKIINLILNHNNAGIRINLCWIPSHVGIPGNETVDHLANSRR